MKYLLRWCKDNLLRFVNSSFSKKYILFLPHDNCEKDGYDICNYTSDNCLSLLHAILQYNLIDSYKIYLSVHNRSSIKHYDEYCKKLNKDIAVEFVLSPSTGNLSLRELLCYYYTYFSSKYIFTSTVYQRLLPITHSQQLICLSYYTIFKDNYNHVLNYYKSKAAGFKNQLNSKYNIWITTSNISSQYNSISFGIDYNKFLALGFSRNDNLINNPKKELVISNIKKITGKSFNKIILYPPTYRDYESKNESIINLLGYKGSIREIDEVLEDYNALLLIKLHPLDKRELEDDGYNNIYLLNTNKDLGLYDYLANTDVLITDYTSAYFDYLILNRPVIFNFYDYDEYFQTRGFAYDPIESVCSGEICKSIESLKNAIINGLDGLDTHKDKRHFVNNMFNKYVDNKSSERIVDQLFP
jgi:CDP-glycerol glycerophosphotransferase (TagB/SpsB family)